MLHHLIFVVKEEIASANLTKKMLISHKHKFIYLSNPKCGSSTFRSTVGRYADVSSQNLSPINPLTIRKAIKDGKSFNDFPESQRDLFIAGLNLLHINASELKVAFSNMNASSLSGSAQDINDWDSFYRFTTIRNPFRRMASYYFFCRPDKNFVSVFQPDHDQESEFHCHFNDWLDNVIHNGYGLPPYQWFCCDPATNELLLDDVFKIENIDETFPVKFKERTGLEIATPMARIMPDKKLERGTRHLRYNGDPYQLYNDNSISLINEGYKQDLETFNYEFGQ